MASVSTIEKKSIAYVIYRNLPKLFESKNIELEDYVKLDILEFNNKKEANGFFVFNGKSKNKKIWIAFITTGSKYMKAAELNKYLDNLQEDEIYIITDVKKKIKITKDVKLIDGSKCCIKNLSKSYNKKGYKYRILTNEEKEHYKKVLFLHNDNIFPGILENDPMVIWSNAKVGDLIEITYPTLTAGGYTGCIREVRSE